MVMRLYVSRDREARSLVMCNTEAQPTLPTWLIISRWHQLPWPTPTTPATSSLMASVTTDVVSVEENCTSGRRWGYTRRACQPSPSGPRGLPNYRSSIALYIRLYLVPSHLFEYYPLWLLLHCIRTIYPVSQLAKVAWREEEASGA